MRNQLFLLLLLSIVSQSALAQNAWIDDEIYVPVRAGAGTSFRILHRGLKSGTRIEILEQPEDGKWVKIRYQDIEGWIGSQYVSTSATAGIQLEQLQSRYKNTRTALDTLKQELATLKEQHQQLKTKSNELEQNLSDRNDKLAHLEEVAADPIRLDQSNRELNEQLSLLRTELDQVKAENAMLDQDRIWKGWMYALATIFAGLALGWFFKGRSSRGRGSWV